MSEAIDHSLNQPIQGYVFGRFRLDLTTHQLLRDGEAIPLSPKGLTTLLVLLANRDRIVAKEDLIKLVWPDSFVSDESLTQSIWGLRRALGDHTKEPQFIATVPRRGYRFVAQVTEVLADTAQAEATVSAAATGAAQPAERLPVQTVSGPPLERSHHWSWSATAALALLLVGLTGAGLVFFRPAARQPVKTRLISFAEGTPPGTLLASGGLLSPNGRHLAMIGRDAQSEKTMIWLRLLESVDIRPLAGTDGASDAFWSPDSESLAFFAENRLKRINIATGGIQAVASLSFTPNGGTWGANGTILFAPPNSSGLQAVPAGGGTVTTVTTLNRDNKEWSHGRPQFLADGDHFLFFVVSPVTELTGLYLGSMTSKETVMLLPPNISATYAAPGYLVYMQDGVLLAQRLNPSYKGVIGEPVTIVGNVHVAPGGARISASDDGLLAYGGGVHSHLVWVDRSGQTLGPLDSPTPLHQPTFFPDQRRLLAIGGGERGGIWLVDLERGGATRVLADSAAPMASADGSHIIFSSSRLAGIADIFRRPSNGSSEDELVLKSNESKTCQDVSPDGKFIVYVSATAKTRTDLWLLPMEGDKRPIPFLQTDFNEFQARVSPDGRWIAYTSDESGRYEVYTQSFPNPGRKQLVSLGGGAQPQWSQDGHELFYLSPDRKMMAVSINPGDSVGVGQPKALFHLTGPGGSQPRRAEYTVSRDGRRFLVDVIDAGGQDPVSVLVNWTSLLSR